MPEYLAPAVYVEETSYRSKPIEGVATSTAAFVGFTRTGPNFHNANAQNGAPPLVTNFREFEELFGSDRDLVNADGSTVPNYMAHAVAAFFREGGSRVYISRLVASGALAAGGDLIPGGGPNSASVSARFEGSAGNGHLVFQVRETPVTREGTLSAAAGTLVRVGDAATPRPAVVTGQRPPGPLGGDRVLRVEVNGAVRNADLAAGTLPEAGGTDIFVDPAAPQNVNLAAASDLTVTVDGGAAVTVTIPAADYAPADLVRTINDLLQTSNAYARIDAARLVIGSARRGILGSIAVADNADLGFAGVAPSQGTGVSNLTNVEPAELEQLLAPGGGGAPDLRVTRTADGFLRIATIATGVGETLQVLDAGANSAHTALGLSVDAVPVAGADAVVPTFLFRQRNDEPGRFRLAGGQWARFVADAALPNGGRWVDQADAPVAPAGAASVVVTLDVEYTNGADLHSRQEDVGLHREHARYLGNVFPANPAKPQDRLENKIAFRIGDGVTPAQLLTAINGLPQLPVNLGPGEALFSALRIAGGADGALDVVQDPALSDRFADALAPLERHEDLSIVAAPGSSAAAGASPVDPIGANLAFHAALNNFVSRRRVYQMAVLDAPAGMNLGSIRLVRSRLDSTRLALYHPWVTIPNPNARPGDATQPAVINVPPSGFICGIYARSDAETGVFKAPANEVIRSAVALEDSISFGEQEVINPEGINAIRFFPGRGIRVWGARLTTSDTEWKYVNIRRYFNYLAASIDRSTQWIVFEPNGERLWALVVEAVSQFLYAEWRTGALLGSTPKEAYFVRCDRTTMTQQDLDSGRLICEIGFAPVKPAEFVIFRLGQKTADARS